MDRDAVLRRHIYQHTLAGGQPPTAVELAQATGLAVDAVHSGLRQLAAARIVVLQPESGEILMAPPFSAVPTPFFVTTPRHRSYANCAWDALGVPVMMRTSAQVTTACGCCGESIELHIESERSPAGSSIVHFAVPAIKWWNDIVFT